MTTLDPCIHPVCVCVTTNPPASILMSNQDIMTGTAAETAAAAPPLANHKILWQEDDFVCKSTIFQSPVDKATNSTTLTRTCTACVHANPTTVAESLEEKFPSLLSTALRGRTTQQLPLVRAVVPAKGNNTRASLFLFSSTLQTHKSKVVPTCGSRYGLTKNE